MPTSSTKIPPHSKPPVRIRNVEELVAALKGEQGEAYYAWLAVMYTRSKAMSGYEKKIESLAVQLAQN